MARHSFKIGDTVTVYQMRPSSGLFAEGEAVIRALVDDVDEQYKVEFLNERGETYERFVDAQGQVDPLQYVIEFNQKIGY